MIEDKFPKISIQTTKLRKLAEQYANLISNLETRRVRGYALDSFLDYHKRKKTFEFQVNDVNKYLQYLSINKAKKESTIKNYLTALRHFFNYLIQIGVIQKNPTKRIKFSEEKVSIKPVILDDLQLNKLFTPDSNILRSRNKFIINVLLFTNLKLNIISTIKKNELRLDNRKYLILGEELGIKSNSIVKSYLKLLEEIETNYLFVNFGKRNNSMPVSTRNIKEIIKIELSAIGVESNFYKVIQTTRLYLEFKKHRSAKKLRIENKLSADKLNIYLTEFHKKLESPSGKSF